MVFHCREYSHDWAIEYPSSWHSDSVKAPARLRWRNMMSDLLDISWTPAMQAPIQLPAGEVIVKTAFICNATLSGIPMSRFAKPNVRGLRALDKAPRFSFFIQHPSGRRILFDVGVRKDWRNLSPVLVEPVRICVMTELIAR